MTAREPAPPPSSPGAAGAGGSPGGSTDEGITELAVEDVTLTQRYGAGDLVSGRYRLLRLLGQGGMGDVWRAHNETLDVDVALKLIRPDAVAPGAADRLLREARAAARLGHPAIVRVFDFGQSELGDPFIVMELLEGEDLATALERRGRLSATRAVRTVLPIAHALVAAHAKGIVHRDLKPENVYLAQAQGELMQPKVVDFGIAKVERAKSVRLTQTGALLGSPAYMSPEQARGDEVDGRADVWALSVVLYELITGKQPFGGKNHNAILYAIIAQEPVPITEHGAGDAALWEVIRRGLEKDPELRWPTMRALGQALAGWLRAQGITEDITGGSLDTAWTDRVDAPGEDELGSLHPPARPPGRGGAETIGEGTTAQRATNPFHRRPASPVLRVAGLALGVGVVVGLVAVLSGRRASPGAASAVPGIPSQAGERRAPAAGAAAEPGEPRSAGAAGDDRAAAPEADGQRSATAPPTEAPGPAAGAAPVASAVGGPAEAASPATRPRRVRTRPTPDAPPRPALKDPFQ